VLTIVDNEPTIQFGATAYSANESKTAATITVKRTGGTATTATVHYATSDGTATAGLDYTASAGILTFDPGVASKTFVIAIANDTLDEPNETVNLALSAPTGAGLGSPSAAVLTIGDNDTAGTIQLSAASYSVNEGDGVATITVTRTGGIASNVSVGYATSNGSALAGTDYAAVSGTLLFGPGETAKTITVPILDDAVAEPAEYLVLSLTAPGGGATLGAQVSAPVWIVDND
jgi:hypothetical protein